MRANVAKNMSIEIREFEEKDTSAVLEMVCELQVAEGKHYDRMKPPEAMGDWYLEGLKTSCREKDGVILVAEEEGSLLGYAVVVCRENSADEPDEVYFEYAYVLDLLVMPRARGKGLGKRLLSACEERAKVHGSQWLRISVLAENRTALGAYRKFGFRDHLVELEKPLGSRGAKTGD